MSADSVHLSLGGKAALRGEAGQGTLVQPWGGARLVCGVEQSTLDMVFKGLSGSVSYLWPPAEAGPGWLTFLGLGALLTWQTEVHRHARPMSLQTSCLSLMALLAYALRGHMTGAQAYKLREAHGTHTHDTHTDTPPVHTHTHTHSSSASDSYSGCISPPAFPGSHHTLTTCWSASQWQPYTKSLKCPCPTRVVHSPVMFLHLQMPSSFKVLSPDLP